MAGVKQNLVTVTVDNLRADHCGFVNAESDLTGSTGRRSLTAIRMIHTSK